MRGNGGGRVENSVGDRRGAERAAREDCGATGSRPGRIGTGQLWRNRRRARARALHQEVHGGQRRVGTDRGLRARCIARQPRQRAHQHPRAGNHCGDGHAHGPRPVPVAPGPDPGRLQNLVARPCALSLGILFYADIWIVGGERDVFLPRPRVPVPILLPKPSGHHRHRVAAFPAVCRAASLRRTGGRMAI